MYAYYISTANTGSNSTHIKVSSPYSNIGCGNCLDKSNKMFASKTVTAFGISNSNQDCFGCSNQDCLDYCYIYVGVQQLVGVTVKSITARRKKCLCNYSNTVSGTFDMLASAVEGSDGDSSYFCFAI